MIGVRGRGHLLNRRSGRPSKYLGDILGLWPYRRRRKGKDRCERQAKQILALFVSLSSARIGSSRTGARQEQRG